MPEPTRFPHGRPRPVLSQPTPALTTRPVGISADADVRWRVRVLQFDSPEAKQALAEGWEPFAGNGCLLWLRRRDA